MYLRSSGRRVWKDWEEGEEGKMKQLYFNNILKEKKTTYLKN